jgi:hypothetical protein
MARSKRVAAAITLLLLIVLAGCGGRQAQPSPTVDGQSALAHKGCPLTLEQVQQRLRVGLFVPTGC